MIMNVMLNVSNPNTYKKVKASLAIVVFICKFANISHAVMFFLERRHFFLAALPNKPNMFSLFLIMLS